VTQDDANQRNYSQRHVFGRRCSVLGKVCLQGAAAMGSPCQSGDTPEGPQPMGNPHQSRDTPGGP